MCGTSKSLSPTPTSPSQPNLQVLPDQFTAEEEAELKLLWEIHSNYQWRCENHTPLTAEKQEQLDSRTIFVGNVDYGASVEEIEQLFDVCGPVKVRFQTDRFTGRRKNHCFVELPEPLMVQLATAMDQIVFRNRIISVKPKVAKKSSEFDAPRQVHPLVKNKYVINNKKPAHRFNPYK